MEWENGGREPGDASEYRILLAEDNNSVRRLVSRILSGEGWQVTAVGSGAEVLSAWKRAKEDYDLIILDLRMPDIGGYQAYRRMAAEAASGISVLFVSGYADSDEFHRAVSREDLPFLAKPFSPQKLLSMVRHLLGLGNLTC